MPTTDYESNSDISFLEKFSGPEDTDRNRFNKRTS
jgi:hypothetical protein